MREALQLIDESDRGAVIVAAALLEEELDQILEEAIRSNNVTEKYVKSMFDLSGPLSSFSSKSLICFGFGFISKEIFDDLTKIRKLRNKFAHSSKEVNFLSPEIEDSISTISCCIEASKSFQGKMFKGRSRVKLEDEPKLEDWEARSMGFEKYSKTVFCIGIQLLSIEIKKFRLKSAKT